MSGISPTPKQPDKQCRGRSLHCNQGVADQRINLQVGAPTPSSILNLNDQKAGDQRINLRVGAPTPSSILNLDDQKLEKQDLQVGAPTPSCILSLPSNKSEPIGISDIPINKISANHCFDLSCKPKGSAHATVNMKINLSSRTVTIGICTEIGANTSIYTDT